MAILFVVNKPEDFKTSVDGADVITAKEYLINTKYSDLNYTKIFNFCRSYSYQSDGYYVSLLAAARGHKAFPNITTIQDSKTQSIIRLKTEEMEALIQKALANVEGKEFEFDVIFGKTINPQFRALGAEIFNYFHCPIMRAWFEKKGDTWKIMDVDPLPPKDIPEEYWPHIKEFSASFINKGNFTEKKPVQYRYDMAILVNPDEPEPPSNPKALKKFAAAAEKLGISTTFIGRSDYNSIGEYDALFIRETTNVHHHTYRFARRAAVEGLVVIDDPESIMRCSNKVYLAELLAKNNIPTPKTQIVHKDNVEVLTSGFDFPIILKLPDSCSSKGVTKAGDAAELKQKLKFLLDKSDLIIAQEYLPTDFDWRIGIIDGKPFYACKYFMVGGHWQITQWTKSGDPRSGRHQTFALEDVPEKVINLAVKAGNLVGKGLYGIDIKTIKNKLYVIEINDNPSIEAGVEDEILKDEIYDHVMRVFLERIEKRKSKEASK